MNTTPSPASAASTVVLRDGSTAELRRLGETDAPALAELLAGLSVESLTFRFFAPRADFERAATQLLASDRGCWSLGAFGEGGRLVAHALYVPTGHGPAEVAFAVADSYQGRGLGTILLGQLAEAAHAGGIDTLEAVVMPGNHQMLALLRESGFPLRTRWDAGEVRVEFPTGFAAATLERFADRDRQAAAAALRRLLAPRSVAVIGASRSTAHVGGRILNNLVSAGYRGPIYPVNSAASEVQGLTAYRSVLDAPRPVELAVVAVPAAAVVEVADECGRAGVRGLVVVSAGFAEAGEEGRERQATLLNVCRRYGMRLIGPNCVGIFNTAEGVRLNVTFAPTPPPPGRIGFLSQSGGLGLALMTEAGRLGLGLSSFVSVGNKADISGNDLLQYWESDPETDVILLYLESFGNARKFARVARRVARQKPIVAVKSGRSAAGARATASHTGALIAASDVTVDALFQQAGVIRTDTLAQLFDVAALASRQPLPAGDRVAIVTNAGGPGILCADACAAAGLEVAELPEDVRHELAAFVSPQGSTVNPIDLLAEATPADFGRTVSTLARREVVDAVIVILTAAMNAEPEDVSRAVEAAIDAGDKKLPVLTVFLGSEQLPQSPALPRYKFPEEAAQALALVARYGEWRARPEAPAEELPGIDRVKGAGIVASAVERGPGWMAPDELAGLLQSYAIPLAQTRTVASAQEAGTAAAELGGQVALKAVGRGLLHKTEMGAVRLGLSGGPEVARAAAEMELSLRSKDAPPDAFLVQRMAPPGVEMLVGVVHDPRFGPVLACGAGGAAAELLRDVSVRITPVTRPEVRRMIRSLKTFPLLDGFRGSAKADVAALEDILLRVGAMVEAHPEIAELDLNPVIVHASGAAVVDARVRLDRPPPIVPIGGR